VTDPGINPHEVAFYETASNAVDVHLTSDNIYIADEFGGVYILQYDDSTEVKSKQRGNEPHQFKIYGNSPNPFNPFTTIRYHIASPGHATLIVYNLLGREIRNLLKQRLAQGEHQVIWDGKDNHGVPVPSGIYFIQLNTEFHVQSHKMALVR